MNGLPRFRLGCALLVLVAWSSPSYGADEPFVVPPDVAKALEPITAGYQPAKRHAEWMQTNEIWNPGNFGRPLYADGPSRIVLQGNGLWLVELSSQFRDKGSAGSGIGLSLCGLVPMLAAGSSSFQPWQGLRGLGDIRIPDAFSTRARVIEFKATSADVCRPTTGLAFEIDLTREVNNRLGLVPTSSKRRERYSCNVGDAVPAASLGVALEASAIKVTCQRRTNDDPPIALEYAFVEPIATYLIVKSVNGDFKTNSAYKSLEFPATN